MSRFRFSLASAGAGHWHGRPGQNVSPADKRSRRAVTGLLYAPIPWLMRCVSAASFAEIQVRHAERFPERGPVLVVANHPATWTDVVVLLVALGRKLHFLAHEALFRPRPRAWLMRLFGALPVAKPGDAAGREARNEATFDRCRTLLGRGEVVAIFPEGVSTADRAVAGFKAGAARIAHDSIANTPPVRVVPIGIHYVDRSAFRTRVVVSVGHPVRLPVQPGPHRRDVDAWFATATARFEDAVEKLILHLPDPALRAVVEELAPLVPSLPSSDPAAFERARRVARWMALLRRDRPTDFVRITRHAHRHRRLREALGLEPLDATRRSRIQQVGLVLSTVVGAPPALAGLILCGPPALLTEHVARRFDPARAAMARISAGGILFILWCAGIAAALAVVTRMQGIALAVPIATLALGACALIWSDGWRELRARLRWTRISWQRPRPMARLRRERAALASELEAAGLYRRFSHASEVAR